MRCNALLARAHVPWHDYNEEAMMIGLDSAFRYFNDKPFYDRVVRPV
jgi:hypothetical protein